MGHLVSSTKRCYLIQYLRPMNINTLTDFFVIVVQRLSLAIVGDNPNGSRNQSSHSSENSMHKQFSSQFCLDSNELANFIIDCSITYPGCQRSSRLPAARSVRQSESTAGRPQRENNFWHQGYI